MIAHRCDVFNLNGLEEQGGRRKDEGKAEPSSANFSSFRLPPSSLLFKAAFLRSPCYHHSKTAGAGKLTAACAKISARAFISHDEKYSLLAGRHSVGILFRF